MACNPMTPLAPAWFSTTTLAPKALPKAGAAARVMASTPEPVALGKMNLTGRSACAKVRPGKTRAVEAKDAKALRRVMLCLMVCLSLGESTGGWKWASVQGKALSERKR